MTSEWSFGAYKRRLKRAQRRQAGRPRRSRCREYNQMKQYDTVSNNFLSRLSADNWPTGDRISILAC